jgi:hypothetical protein
MVEAQWGCGNTFLDDNYMVAKRKSMEVEAQQGSRQLRPCRCSRASAMALVVLETLGGWVAGFK